MSHTSAPWWRNGVLYQIYPRSFRDANGDGIGDLQGIIQRLPYLVDLGVDALWLSPVYPSPQVDFGYDVMDHCDIDPCYGDLPTFDGLVEAAHRAGLRVLMDYVINHTSDRHPWFRDHPEFYVWREPAADGGPPNNWVSVFGGSAWTLADRVGKYYLHSFHPAQPDLDWRNPAVEAAMFDVLRFWLDRGVDGFRIDAPEFVGKDPQLRDNPRRPRHLRHRRGVLRPYDAFEHVHDKDHPDLHGILRRLRAVVDAYDDRAVVGEVRIRDRTRWASYFGNGDEMHLVFDFGPLKGPFTAAGVRGAVESTLLALGRDATPALVLGNHDEPRIRTRYGDGGARLAAVLLATLPGTPCLYYGDELGMVDAEVPRDAMRDPQGSIDPSMSRDPCRSPVPWTASGGFCPADVAPWLPMDPNLGQTSVAQQRGDASSMLSLYRRLLRLRREHPALRVGAYETHAASDDEIYVFWRQDGDDRVLVALNFGPEWRALPVELGAPGRTLFEAEDGKAVIIEARPA